MDDIFDSAVRSAGDLAGVFEYDGETGYFYLYSTGETGEQEVLDAIQVLMGVPDFSAQDITVRWDSDEEKVGLFIRNVVWAVFDSARRTKYGARYRSGGIPSLPLEALANF